VKVDDQMPDLQLLCSCILDACGGALLAFLTPSFIVVKRWLCSTARKILQKIDRLYSSCVS